MGLGDDFSRRVYRYVKRIPTGNVATYGQIARALGQPRHARQVGRALRQTPPGERLPWHRVVNSRGEIRVGPGTDDLQRILLEDEGVQFDPSDRVELSLYQWSG